MDEVKTELQKTEERVQKISDMTGFTKDKIALVKNTIAKGVNDIELAFFLSVAKETGLDPFMKEIWCYKDGKNNLITFAGRDGFLKKAQSSPTWNGLTSFEVCTNDIFELNAGAGTVKHIPNFKDRGAIIGAYAICKPKGCEFTTIEWAEFSVYNKGSNVWKSDPASMIKKVAETHCLKKAFGISGLQVEYDYDVVGNTAISLQHTEPFDDAFSKALSDIQEVETLDVLNIVWPPISDKYNKDGRYGILCEAKDAKKRELQGAK